MSEFVALRSLVFAAECFFGASLILALAFLAARDGSASRRHMIWLGAFIAMLALPVAAAMIPPQVIVHMPAEPKVVISEADLAALAALHTAPAPQPLFTLPNVLLALIGIWLTGVAVIVAQTLTGLIGLFFLHRRSVPHIPNGIDGAMFRGARWQLRLRTMPGNEGPVTYGILKPTVLLPKVSVRWSRARLQAVLLHEFAHVRRRDSLARLIAQTACAFYWPNPFVWSAAARLKREAEIAADDAVLASGVRASSYAEALVSLARECEHTMLAGVTLSMAERSTLKERIHAVLSPVESRKGVTRMDVLKIGVSCLALTAGLVAARPCLAEAKPAEIQIVREVADVTPPQAPDAMPDAPDAPSMPDVADMHDVPAMPDVPPAPEAAPPAPMAVPATAPVPPIAAMPPAPPAPVTDKRIVVKADKVFFDATGAKKGPRHLFIQAETDKNDPGRSVMRLRYVRDGKEMRLEGNTDIDAATAHVAPEFDKAAADSDKAMAHVHDHAVVVDREAINRAVRDAREAAAQARAASREDVRQAVAEAHRATEQARRESRAQIEKALAEARQARQLNREEIRKAMAQARVSRVKALEEARAQIDRELAKARQEAERSGGDGND